jgi:hypothetical protein
MILTGKEQTMYDSMERYYNSDRACPNMLSFWHPRVKDVPGLRQPKTITVPVPLGVFAAFENDDVQSGMEDIKAFLDKDVIPAMRETSRWFLKNGCFSNKFDFRNCITNAEKLLDDFISIQYSSVCLETNGVSEINLRQVIPWDSRKTLTVYHGMPLRTEIRVFYDFDSRKVLYSANYWDYWYIAPHLRDRTDKLVFDAARRELLAGYETNRAHVEETVARAMREADMTGRWSVDILVETDDNHAAKEGGLWLIDMAQAERSAYWDETKGAESK